MGLQDRIRQSLTGGGDGGSDPPEYGCTACENRFRSNSSPRRVTCPDCDSDDVELLANPDLADGSHPLDPNSGGESGGSDADSGAPDDKSDDDRAGESGDLPDDEEAAVVRELLTTGRYRCQDCREAFDPADDGEAVCPECGSDDAKARFD